MKWEIFYECSVWKKNKVQNIEAFDLHLATSEFARIIRLPGVIYAKLFQDGNLIAYYVASGINVMKGGVIYD